MNSAPRNKQAEKSDQLPKSEALKRADNMLRNMLNSPPAPHVPKKKPKKRAK
jgi:hypothetical protein